MQPSPDPVYLYAQSAGRQSTFDGGHTAEAQGNARQRCRPITEEHAEKKSMLKRLQSCVTVHNCEKTCARGSRSDDLATISWCVPLQSAHSSTVDGVRSLLCAQVPADHTMEFFAFHGAEKNDPTGVSQRAKAESLAQHQSRHMPNAWKTATPMSGTQWNSAVKVRHFESIHLPEYNGWHNKGNHTDSRAGNKAFEWSPPPEKRKYVSRGPAVSPSPNCGFKY